MIKDVFVINNQSQIKAISTELKLQIVNELIKNSCTCQQLSIKFDESRQKVHYILKELNKIGLIKRVDLGAGKKEIFYRAKASNYVIDFSLGKYKDDPANLHNRKLKNFILKSNHNIDLSKIAHNFLENALKMQAHEKILIVTGEYNMPFVKKLLLEAAKKQIATTLLYKDKEMLEAKHNEFSLETYSWENENFYKLLEEHDVYLYFNGESRNIPLTDPEKKLLLRKALTKNREIIRKKNIRIAVMRGLINDNISEKNILSEVNFWKSLDIDYQKLANDTHSMINDFKNALTIEVHNRHGSNFSFKIDKIFCECGSFTDFPDQTPIINIPGGEISIIPAKKSVQGTIIVSSGYIFGKEIKNLSLTISNNKITKFHAEKNEDLIKKAIDNGGTDGKDIALISLGTNYNLGLSNIDPSYKNKSKDILTLFWGNNESLGGTIKGLVEWEILLEKPEIKKISNI
ncbi:MAG: aminopeptidase [Candidatus Cloacimonetes bacterium]|nr:aminopeptidase [Candidatus Cloacimonadota bacterium]